MPFKRLITKWIIKTPFLITFNLNRPTESTSTQIFCWRKSSSQTVSRLDSFFFTLLLWKRSQTQRHSVLRKWRWIVWLNSNDKGHWADLFGSPGLINDRKAYSKKKHLFFFFSKLIWAKIRVFVFIFLNMAKQ